MLCCGPAEQPGQGGSVASGSLAKAGQSAGDKRGQRLLGAAREETPELKVGETPLPRSCSLSKRRSELSPRSGQEQQPHRPGSARLDLMLLWSLTSGSLGFLIWKTVILTPSLWGWLVVHTIIQYVFIKHLLYSGPVLEYMQRAHRAWHRAVPHYTFLE